MSITRRILFISEDKIKENSIIQLNVDGKVLAQSIYDTQFSHLREITGDTLYSSLLDAVAATKVEPSVPLTGDIRTLLLDYVQPFLSRAVLLKLLINLHYRVTDKGVLKYNDSQATSISASELEYARNQLENEANAFKRILIKYLKEKFNDAGCESRDNDTTSRSIGWYLGGSTARTGGGILPEPVPPPPVIVNGNGFYIGNDKSGNIGVNPEDDAGYLKQDTRFLRGKPDNSRYTELAIYDGSTVAQTVQQDTSDPDNPIVLTGSAQTVETTRIKLEVFENDETGALSADGSLEVNPGNVNLSASFQGYTGAISATYQGAGVKYTTPDNEFKVAAESPGVGFIQMSAVDTSTGQIVRYIRIGQTDGASGEQGMIIRDDLNLRGLEYYDNYAANYTDRSLIDKGYLRDTRGWVTPEDFGAIGDGVTDDTAAFVTMAASLVDMSKVRLANSYVIQSNQVAIAGLTGVEFDARGGKIVAPDNEPAQFLWALGFTSCTFINWIGGTFDRKNSVTVGSRQIGFRFAACTDINLKDVYFEDVYFGATTSNDTGVNKRIRMEACAIFGKLDYTPQRDADFVLSENLIYLPAAEECHFLKCVSFQTGHLLLEDSTTACKYNIVDGCICRESHDSGIYMKGLASKVINCYVFDAGKDPIKHLGSGLNGQHVIIANNHIERAGIHKTDGGTYINAVAPGAMITGNTIVMSDPGATLSPSHTAILFNSNSIIANNNIHGVGASVIRQIGIQPAAGNISNVNIVGNLLYDIRNGIEFDPSVSRKYQNISIRDNTFSNIHTGVLVFIGVQAYDGTLFTGLIINSNTFSGYSFGTSISNVEKVVVTDNVSILQTGSTNGTYLYYNGCKDAVQMNNTTDGLETTYSQKLTYNGQLTNFMVSTANYKAATLQDASAATFNVVKINGIGALLDLRAQVNYNLDTVIRLRYEGAWIRNKDTGKDSCFLWSHQTGTATLNNITLILSTARFGSYTNPDEYATNPTVVTDYWKFRGLDGTFETNKLLVNTVPSYANDAAADADVNLLSKMFYKITGSRAIYQKP